MAKKQSIADRETGFRRQSPVSAPRVPFSVFPSTYRNEQAQAAETTEVKTDERVSVQGAGREEEVEERFSRRTQQAPSRRDDRYTREDIRITERERESRPGRVRREEDVRIYEDDRYSSDRRDVRVDIDRQRYREPYRRYSDAQIDVQDRVYDREGRVHTDHQDYHYHTRHTPATQVAESRIDRAEAQYRGWQNKSTYPREYPEASYPERQPVTYDERVKVTESRTVDPPRGERKHRIDMGYYDEDGHYHSFRHGLHRAADRILYGPQQHHRHEHRPVERQEDIVIEDREITMSAPRGSSGSPIGGIPNTITIPCHHIRIGDLLILQGRPCQVIRITTSAQTGQHRYLGVDLFSKQLHEESSFVSNPSPSVVVQNMLGPVFKQYRVLDIRDDGRVVAMTETGDVKQGLPVLDQSNLLGRLQESFNDGRGSVRVLVINDDGQELAVDYKVVHGSRL
ncbi:Eukaryotic elongation factor 5A hypusine, DNA-binding OB fold [Teratosphaeria destructans]|uniref:Eukaryotic elongation factor 5A hypusine, DNA-binding OB fold n=1 Tax=Teratosphaeria destructans TaxID=418781 RepID=A0A9W7SN65_9PEZI|nr:Eukaryotic elongation factor 5A hypusine, DNA-binding OB fold [Teratosphaeria destructans]